MHLLNMLQYVKKNSDCIHSRRDKKLCLKKNIALAPEPHPSYPPSHTPTLYWLVSTVLGCRYL